MGRKALGSSNLPLSVPIMPTGARRGLAARARTVVEAAEGERASGPYSVESVVVSVMVIDSD